MTEKVKVSSETLRAKATEVDLMSWVMRRAPIFRLRRQRSLLALPKIAQLVEQHLGGNPETFDAIAATETY